MNALDLVYLPAAVVTAPIWARKARGGWAERFGKTPSLPAPAGRRVLLHAVSVGEVNTLRGLVPMLRGRGLDVVVSATTDTGLARATELYAKTGLASVVRYPLDFSAAVRRFLDAVRPDAVGLVELELWPNFVGECRRRGVPVGVVNGRLSARSFRGYARARVFMRRSFSSLAFAAVQEEAYAERFRFMGAPRVMVTGSMKWDALGIGGAAGGAEGMEAADRLARELGIDRSRPLVVAGSTAPLSAKDAGAGCEEGLLDACVGAGVQVLCAPRKPEHFDAAFAALGGASRCVRRSEKRARAGDRFLLDTIGELRAAYALADVVVVGRSFGDLYGSDVMEVAALGKPALIGPSYADFGASVEALRESGAVEVVDRAGLGGAIARLLGDAGERARRGDAARACVRANQGATARHADLLAELAASASVRR